MVYCLRVIVASMAVAVFGCSSVRKISRVETRELSSVRAERVASPLRLRLSALDSVAAACPAELRELLPSLAGERVSFPPCPPSLQADFESAYPYLGMEERSTIEAILSGQCRSVDRDSFEEPLETLLNEFETSRPEGRPTGPRGERRLSSSEDHSDILQKLKGELEEVYHVNLPLDQWTRRFGQFVIAEDQLEFFDNLALKQGCKMRNQEIDRSYRTIRGLEELVKIEREEEPQRARIERFLQGVHKVMDRRLQEFFFP